MDGRHALTAVLALASVLQPSPAPATESVPETTVVVGKSTFKDLWSLPFEKATLTCRPKGYANTMATPQGEFALNDPAKAEGFPELKTIRLNNNGTPDNKAGLDDLARAADEFCSKRWSRS